MSRFSNELLAFVRSSQGRSLCPSKTKLWKWISRAGSVRTTRGRTLPWAKTAAADHIRTARKARARIFNILSLTVFDIRDRLDRMLRRQNLSVRWKEGVDGVGNCLEGNRHQQECTE